MAETKNTTRESDFLLGIPVPVKPESIDRELSTMWKAASGDAPMDSSSCPVTRVCLANLIWIGSTASSERARRVLTAVAQRCPSRIIILEVDGDDESDDLIEAYVNAQCFIAGSERQQVCSEFIHFRMGAGAVTHLSGIVAPLLLPDLETVLWYFSPDPAWQAGVEQIMPLLDRYVTEVSTSHDPAEALEHVIDAHLRAFTLGWFRLNSLRDRIAKVFDDGETAAMLPQINELEFIHDGAPANPNALTRCALLAGWMASRLGWRALTGASDGSFLFQGSASIVNVRIEGEGRSRAGLIESVRIGFSRGENITLNLGGVGCSTHATALPGTRGLIMPSLGAFSELEEAEALGAAITTRGASALFRESARLAVPMLRHFHSTKAKG